MARKVKSSGTKRMGELGSKRVAVWLDPAELLTLTRGAKLAGLPLSTYLRVVALVVADHPRITVTGRRVAIDLVAPQTVGKLLQVHEEAVKLQHSRRGS